MLLAEFLTALIFALLFIAVLVGAFGWGRRGTETTWGAVMFAFLVFLFAIWAGGLWVTPVGPAIYGVTWMPFLLVGLFVFLLLLAAAAPAREWRWRQTAAGVRAQEEESVAALGVFFWLLLALLVIGLFFAYV